MTRQSTQDAIGIVRDNPGMTAREVVRFLCFMGHEDREAQRGFQIALDRGKVRLGQGLRIFTAEDQPQ